MRALSLLLGLGCAGEPTTAEAPSDQQLYLQSMDLVKTDVAGAIERCRSISTEDLKAECLVFLAKDIAKGGGDGRQVCAEVGAMQWSQVCYFELVDAQGLTGTDAVEACRHTGHVQERCLSHAIQRDLSKAERRFGAGQEQELYDWVAEQVELYGLRSTRPDFPGEMTARVIARRRGLGSTRTFTRADCGNASEAVCQEAYLVVLREQTRRRSPGALCTGEPAADEVSAAGWPAWEPELETLARAAWSQACRDQRR